MHAAHIGHPVVCDGRYSSAFVFESDVSWCPRNFLHRHLLRFSYEARELEVYEPLPGDLREALERVEPLGAAWHEVLPPKS